MSENTGNTNCKPLMEFLEKRKQQRHPLSQLSGSAELAQLTDRLLLAGRVERRQHVPGHLLQTGSVDRVSLLLRGERTSAHVQQRADGHDGHRVQQRHEQRHQLVAVAGAVDHQRAAEARADEGLVTPSAGSRRE